MFSIGTLINVSNKPYHPSETKDNIKMVSCSVLYCNENQRQGSLLFRIPANKAIRKKWILKCKFKSKFNGNSRICGKHFTSDSLYKIGNSTKIHLKAKAIPKLFVIVPEMTPGL